MLSHLKNMQENRWEHQTYEQSFGQTFVASCEVVSYSSTEKESLKKVADANYESQLQSQYGVDLDSYLEAASMSKRRLG